MRSIDSSSFTLPSEPDVHPTSPPVGSTVCTASLRLPITASPVSSLPMPSEAPSTVQISPVHSDIEILPVPPCSPVAVTTAPLACAPPLTERALRSQRRDALRALHDVVVTSSPSTVHLYDSLSADGEFGAQTKNAHIQSFTSRQRIPVHNYSNSAPAPRVTTHVANRPPFTVRVAPPRVFTPLAALRASRSTMSTTSAPLKHNTGTAAQVSIRTDSPPPSASGPLLDFSPMGPTGIRATTGSRTGRTPGLRPTAPLTPHLEHWAFVWNTLTPQQRAEVGQVSLHEVEEGLARTRVSAEAATATDSDHHAIDLGTAEHERVAAPLRSQLTISNRHRTTAHTELKECEARVAAIDAQEHFTAAALAAEKRRHASFLSGLSAQPPAPPQIYPWHVYSKYCLLLGEPFECDGEIASVVNREGVEVKCLYSYFF